MENIDPRIDAIYEADPLLKLVGPGTITDVLNAAAKAGLSIHEVNTGTLAGAEAIMDVHPTYNRPVLVSRDLVSFAAVAGEWQTASAEVLEDARA
ncbi:hypothetical protein [Arthrobacter methylotrophus]|uniref:Uncharacterized protein n=1 Tax=Arthrobacter methylotrophus TaxID=121291 RepID=A0ABV5UNK5_9MICC